MTESPSFCHPLTRVARVTGLATVLLLTACDQQQTALVGSKTAAALDQRALTELAQGSAELRFATNRLADTITTYTDNPGPATLAAARTAWQAAHLAWHGGELWIRVLSPDSAETKAARYRIDSWPILPGFLDGTATHPASGLIHDESLELTTATLLQEHGVTDLQEVALGLHAIEYYLWGRPTADLVGAGRLPKRRRQFLTLAGAQLVRDVAAALGFEGSPTDDLTRHSSELIASLNTLFLELNQLASERAGHAAFSGTSLATARRRVASIELAMAGEGGVFDACEAVDALSVGEIRVVLAELKALLNGEFIEPEAWARAPLLASALGHFIEAFVETLTEDAANNGTSGR